MMFDVETKDCTALSDSELAEMADIVADGPAGLDIGLLSKQRDEWVLITQARDRGRLVGFSFCTLERIGGTPCVLWGLVSVKRCEQRTDILDALRADQFRKAVLAFPDEDVLVATRLREPGGFAAFSGLVDICPRPGYRVSGEERAWSRRLAKRFGADGRVDDRSFIVRGDSSPCPVFDYEPERRRRGSARRGHGYGGPRPGPAGRAHRLRLGHVRGAGVRLQAVVEAGP